MATRTEVQEELDEWNKLSKIDPRVYVELNLLSNEELSSMSVTEAADMCMDLSLDYREDKKSGR